MKQENLGQLIDEIIRSNRITTDDVFRLRRTIYDAQSVVSQEEAEALLYLNENVSDADPAWSVLFPEALADFVVHQMKPAGYVTEDQSNWLIAAITRDDHICTPTELDAILKIMDVARSVPKSLELFALEAVKDSVIHGACTTRSGKELKPGVISDAEVELIRQILYAGANGGGIAISREEAEILFDINDATAEADNAPAWSELFAKAVANFLMGLSGFTPPSREVALARENWLSQEGGFDGGVSGFFKSMVGASTSTARDAYNDLTRDPAAERTARLAEEIAANEVVTESEARWLVDRIGRDGILHENEKALLRFIHEESPNIHPLLEPLMEKVVGKVA
ncbi:hypothetical protein [Roseibium sediminis]|uniref:hypothetical protein n=1 Tax=Roseibium sediminis TaxID=1775174 RepID=UPI00123CBDD5|nr:hypothetical protein [Roseibium sediminis]